MWTALTVEPDQAWNGASRMASPHRLALNVRTLIADKVDMRARHPLVLAALTLVSVVGACSSTALALKTPSCSLLSQAQARIALASPEVRVVMNRPGYCAETGTGAGSRVSTLTVEIHPGSDASRLPAGVTGPTFPPEPLFYTQGGSKNIEAYEVPMAATESEAQQGLHAYLLSANKDGYVIRVEVGGLYDALGGARLALEGLLPHV